MSANGLGLQLQRWRLAAGETSWRERAAYALPLLPVWLSVLVLGVALLPEVTVAVPSLNDDAAHYSLVLNASRALDAGKHPLDHWAADLELGYPQFAYYQHLPHVFVVAVDRLLLRQVELLTLFNLTRYVLLVGFPLTVYWSLRQLGFTRPAAGAAAAIAPLLSAGHKFGLEYDSYVWRGFGMYTQLWAMHLMFLSLGLVHRTLRDGKGYLASTLALTALVLSHVIYAFITALMLGFLLLSGITRANARQRTLRLLAAGVPAVIASAYFWLPLILNGAYHATSPYMEDWKYNSHGAGQVLTWLVKGELFDYGRPPVITVFAAVGVGVALWTRSRLGLLALAVFGFWLVAYFGRPTLGPVADVLSFDGKLWMHRFIGPVQAGGILLVAVAAGGVWTLVHRYWPRSGPARAEAGSPDGDAEGRPESAASVGDTRTAQGGFSPWPAGVFVALVLAVSVTALVERWTYLDHNDSWMRETEQALAGDAALRDIVRIVKANPRGRVYAGLRSGFSEEMRVGSLRVADVLTFYQVETAAAPYQSLSLNSDLIWHFDYRNQAHYRVFNAGYAVLPAGLNPPDFLTLVVESERYKLYEAPGGGYIGLGETAAGYEGSEEAFHIAARSWFLGVGPGAGVHPAFAIPGAPKLTGLEYGDLEGASTAIRRLRPQHDGSLGAIESEVSTPFAYEAVVRMDVAGTVFLKATFHPDWRVTVDGHEVETFMAAPSFPAIHLEPGTYFVRFEYGAHAARTPLLALGLLTLGLVAVVGRTRN